MNFLKNNVIRLSRKLCAPLPVSFSKVYFENFRGKGFGDDPRYIAEELHKRNPKLKLYWLVTDQNTPVPAYVKPVRYLSFWHYYALATSAVWVSNIKNSYKPYKKKGQYYVQTWHSTLGLKKNEEEAGALEADYVAASKHDASMTDLMYSDNDFRFEKYHRHYWYSGEVLKCDVPRIGAIVNRREEFRQKICETYGIDQSKKIVLYMPTFRKSRTTEAYDVDHSAYLRALDEKFGGEHILVMKFHPTMAGGQFPNMPKNAVDASAHTDPYELISACDILISDYSGCLFDAVFTKKPVFLIGKDKDAYIHGDRGFAIDPEELPVPICENEEQLIRCIAQYQQDEYERACDAFAQRVGYSDSGNGAAFLCDLIERHLK